MRGARGGQILSPFAIPALVVLEVYITHKETPLFLQYVKSCFTFSGLLILPIIHSLLYVVLLLLLGLL